MSDQNKSSPVEERRVLVFKHEAEAGGEPIGPVTILSDTPSNLMETQVVTVPFVPICACEQREGLAGHRCRRCGREIPEPWVTLTEAKARARELGLALTEC